ncbi:MAG: urease accessory protein UreE [Janthinobacterium lividum]
MLTLHTKLDPANLPEPLVVADELILPLELREKSRQRATMASGEEVALFTLRGTVLRDGDLLRGDDERVVRVRAALEPTCRVECDNARALLRCAFHLGNRHTQAQVAGLAEHGFLRIRKDAVLKEMLEGLGARVTEELAPFEPESGAYGGVHGHGHHDAHHPLAPVPLRQKIHRPSDAAEK